VSVAEAGYLTEQSANSGPRPQSLHSSDTSKQATRSLQAMSGGHELSAFSSESERNCVDTAEPEPQTEFMVRSAL